MNSVKYSQVVILHPPVVLSWLHNLLWKHTQQLEFHYYYMPTERALQTVGVNQQTLVLLFSRTFRLVLQIRSEGSLRGRVGLTPTFVESHYSERSFWHTTWNLKKLWLRRSLQFDFRSSEFVFFPENQVCTLLKCWHVLSALMTKVMLFKMCLIL